MGVVFLSGGAVTMLMWMLRRGNAARATSLLFLAPPLAALQGYWLFGETLAAIQLAGFALALVGVVRAALTRPTVGAPCSRAHISRHTHRIPAARTPVTRHRCTRPAAVHHGDAAVSPKQREIAGSHARRGTAPRLRL